MFAFNITKNQTNAINEAMMEQLKTKMDNQMDDLETLLMQIALNKDVQQAAYKRGSFEAEDQLMLYHLMQDLQTWRLSNDYIDDIFISFNQTDTVLSTNGHMTSELFYHLYYESNSMNQEDFTSYLKENHSKDHIRYEKLNGQRCIILLQNTLAWDVGGQNATVVLTVNEALMNRELSNMRWQEGSELGIVDEFGDYVGQSSETIAHIEETFFLNDENGLIDNITIDDVKVALMYRESDVLPWKYVTIVPLDLYEATAHKIQWFTTIGFFVCALLGAVMSYFLARTNYSPVKRIMDTLTDNGTSVMNKDENEFQWLENQVQDILKEHNHNKVILKSNELRLKNYFIFRLLEYAMDERQLEEDIKRFRLQLKGPYNAVVVFEAIGMRSLEADGLSYETELNLTKFIIRNIFGEIVGNQFNHEVTDVGERVVFIVNLPEQDFKYVEILESAIDAMQLKIQEHYAMKVVAFIGNMEHGIEGIRRSYMMANEAAQYMPFLQENDIIYYEEIKNVQRHYVYEMETEQKIINAIKTGNSDSAIWFLKDVFESNFYRKDGKKISMEFAKCLLFDIMGTIIKGVELAGLKDWEVDVSLIEELGSKSLEEIEVSIAQTMETICQRIRLQQKENEDDTMFSQKVKSYILENYQDPDLNISQTGLAFQITPAYLSSLFKSQTGESLLDYINHTRVSKAKILLQEGHSIVEIAQMVGYRNSSSFIRVFKKIEGVTPGQLKKTMEQ